MKRIISYSAFVLVLIVFCGYLNQLVSAESKKGPKLKINASPRQGFSPLNVTFRGLLEEVDPGDKEYYCLQEEWDYGDGAVSSEKPNCDPFTPETKIKTEFFSTHVYESHGSYTVRLILGDEKVRSKQISIVIVERDRGYD